MTDAGLTSGGGLAAPVAQPYRVRIIGSRHRLDCALPGNVSLASLLPALLYRAEPEAPDMAHSGWVLQRAGEAPLDPARTLDALGVRTGDVLYLRPTAQALPALAVDDVVEAVGEAARALPRRWAPHHTRTAALCVAAVAGFTGTLLLGVASEWAGAWLVATAGTIAALLLAAGVLVSRSGGNAGAALLAALAVPYAFECAATAVRGHGAVFTPGSILAGFAAAGLVALLAAAGTDLARIWFSAAAAAFAAGQVCAAVALATDAAAGAAAGSAVAVLVSPLVPALATRVGGVPRPFVPDRPAAVRDQPTTPARESVAASTARADRCLTALIAAIGAVCLVTAIPLAHAPGWAGPAQAALVGAALALRARHLTAIAARVALLVAATGSLAAVAAGLAARVDGRIAMLALAGAAAVAVVAGVAVAAAAADGHRSPWWRRLGDLLEVLALLATAPVALHVLGAYQLARALAG